MTKSSATSQIEGKNKTIDYKKLYQEQAKKHQLMLSQISHEIRNPVTLINSFLQILEKQHPDLSEDQNWIKILENMDFLRGLLGELSSYNNSLRLNLESTNVYALFANVIASINPSLEKKNVSIAFNKLSPIPLLYVDHTKLQQVFHNLLRNAFEAVKEGGHIVCSIESDGTGVTFKVTDDGCGISLNTRTLSLNHLSLINRMAVVWDLQFQSGLPKPIREVLNSPQALKKELHSS